MREITPDSLINPEARNDTLFINHRDFTIVGVEIPLRYFTKALSHFSSLILLTLKRWMQITLLLLQSSALDSFLSTGEGKTLEIMRKTINNRPYFHIFRVERCTRRIRHFRGSLLAFGTCRVKKCGNSELFPKKFRAKLISRSNSNLL